MRQLSVLMLLSITFLFSTARADVLPDVENVRVEGQLLTWDAQDGATGYNIIFEYGYYDTVRDALTYQLNEAGTYSVIAFNDMDDYGKNHSLERVKYAGESNDASINYDYQYRTLLVYKTCKDVGPGESCIAVCPNSYRTQFNNTVFIDYMSGGACSTSDIIEADAFISADAYKCTVPTYSGEVVAQAICPIRR